MSMARNTTWTSLIAALIALAVVLASPVAASGSGAARTASSCSGFTSTVIGSGAEVSQLHVRGASCGEGHSMAHRWLEGIDHSDGRYLYNCSPPAGAPAGHCSMRGYNCKARGVSGALADTVSCRHGGELVSWRADFDREDGSAP